MHDAWPLVCSGPAATAAALYLGTSRRLHSFFGQLAAKQKDQRTRSAEPGHACVVRNLDEAATQAAAAIAAAGAVGPCACSSALHAPLGVLANSCLGIINKWHSGGHRDGGEAHARDCVERRQARHHSPTIDSSAIEVLPPTGAAFAPFHLFDVAVAVRSTAAAATAAAAASSAASAAAVFAAAAADRCSHLLDGAKVIVAKCYYWVFAASSSPPPPTKRLMG